MDVPLREESMLTSPAHSSYWSIKWYGGRGRFDINQGLAAASTVPPMVLVIQIPAVTAMAPPCGIPALNRPTPWNCSKKGGHWQGKTDIGASEQIYIVE